MVGTLKASNIELMNRVRSQADLTYQTRIPVVDQGNFDTTVRGLLSNRPALNEFVGALLNRIGLTVGHNIVWESKLKQFKKELLNAGDTVEEVQTGLLKAHAYSANRDALEQDIFGQETPDVSTIFHRVNEARYYKLTINEDLLKRAFLSGDTYGISGFVNDLMSTMATSDNFDEYTATCKLFSKYDENGGFYKVNVPNVSALSSDADAAKGLLRSMREMAGNMQFPSTRYNAAHMPTVTTPNELVLLSTPALQAAIDVEALAAAFNVDYMKFPSREVTIREEDFGIDGAQAIITTNSFFQIYDTLQEMRTISNPARLYDNYFFHHWQIISCSLFAPAVLFTTGPGTAPDPITVIDPTAITVSLDPDNNGNAVTGFKAGGIYSVSATMTPDDASAAVRWNISGNTSVSTYIDPDGVVHVGYDEVAESLSIVAVGVENGVTSSVLIVPVTGGKVEWPATSH